MDLSGPRPSDSSPLLEHLETLYPLACILVGPEEAPHLLRRIAEDARETPTADHPADVKEWLHLLLQTARNNQALSATDFRANAVDEGETADVWRRDAAEQIIEAALPIVLARCTPQQRFLLALDGMDMVSVSSQKGALGDAVDTTRSEVRETLWTTLEDILSDTEYELVDKTVSEEALQKAIDDLLATRYPTVPRSLRSQLQETLHTPRGSETKTSPPEASASVLERLPPRPKPRTLLFALLIGALVLVGGLGLSYYIESSPAASSSPSRSLVAFSAEQASSITVTQETNSRPEAAAVVDSAWNRRVTVPAIEGAELEGVGQLRTTGGTEIPVVLHADGTTRLTTFIYNYALLRRIGSEATLSPEIRGALTNAHQLVDADGKTSERALLWRDRDDIFVTVAPALPTDSLRARLRPQD